MAKTVEDRLRDTVGDLIMQNVQLSTQVEQLRERVQELEHQLNKDNSDEAP